MAVHTFEIRFVTLRVRAVRNRPARLVNLRETVITDAYLLYEAAGGVPDADVSTHRIRYSIIFE